ncbi:MAG TPA: hypothetical protein VEJ20_00650 [Candidatus Eremiobacteraceae bacterium]|nr:hypothetical protein [Candidatus Eremiobacteraceae bacterium]
MKQAQLGIIWAVNIILYIALLDAAIETFVAGSPIRWVVAGVVIVYAAITVLTWKREAIGSKTLSSVIVLALLTAYSGWSTGSLAAGGLVLAQQSAAVIGAALLIVVLLVAVIALVFARSMPLWLRACAVVLSLYLILPLVASLRGSSGASAALAGTAMPFAQPFWLRGAYLTVEIALPLLFVACLVTAAIALARRRPGALFQLYLAVATLLAIQIGAFEAGAQGLPTILAFEHPPVAQSQSPCNGAMATIDTVAPGGSSAGSMGFGGNSGSGSANVLGGSAQTPAPSSTPCANAGEGGNSETAASGSQTTAAPSATGFDTGKLSDDLDKTLDALQSYDSTAPRDSYDPQAVVDEVGHDPVKLFEWVRDNTALAPYSGSLRGPVGVLLDRVGSSLDRALLLAQLEQLAGVQARLAHAHLSADQARGILAAMRPAPQIPATSSSSADVPATSGAQTDAAIEAWDSAEKARQDALNSQVTMLTSLVPDSGQEDPSVQNAEMAAIEDHWWVQVENGGTWSDLDPSVPNATPGKTLVKPLATMAAEQVDPGLFHQLDIRVVIETWHDGKYREDVVLQHQIRPSEVIGQPIEVTFAPNGLSQGGDTGNTISEQIEARALAVEQWQPVLEVGDQTIQQASFKVSGSSGELTAVWLEFELRSPGMPPSVIRRQVMDIRGPAARAQAPVAPVISDSTRLERSLALLSDIHVVPMVSDVSPQFVLHESIQGLTANRDLLSRVISAGTNASQSDLKSSIDAITSLQAVLYTLALERGGLSPVRADRFLDRINVLSSYIRPEVEGDRLVSQEMLDIANNEVAVWPGVPDARRVQLEQGIADTFAEQAALPDDEPGQNTADLFGAYGAQGNKPILVLPNQESSVQGLDISPDARARLDADLAEGYGAVVPSQPVDVDGEKRFGWWRVDPRSGGSIGVMDSGFHQALTERTEISPTMISPGEGGPCWNMVGLVGDYGDILRAVAEQLSDEIMDAWAAGLNEYRKFLTQVKLDVVAELHGC